MHWGSAAEFLAMGGYALYVWGSYLVTALVICVEVAVLVRRGRTLRARAGRIAGPGSD
ncbi:MAG TPA: heme exporter protein CcmD [Burkholderiales bacterium]|jgi:heme exporter protein D|nr:heme exporter protein CcmD [Burkholderiales bacterium]